jgi:hypothetical protein
MRPVAIGLHICLIICSSPALAQNATSAKRTEVRINASFNISQPVAVTDAAGLIEIQANARKAVYEIVGRECKLLLDTIASECRLESLNVSSNEQNQNFRGDSSTILLNTTGNSTFRILLKD